MQKHKRQLAFLVAVGVLAAGFPREIANYNKVANARVSVLSFADALKGSAPVCNSGQMFSELRLSAGSSQLLRDGKAVGDSFGGFAVRDGKLLVDTAAAGVEGGGLVSPEEAAELIGCEVYEQGGDVVLTAPFQTGTLIVKADTLNDRHGALSCVEGYHDLHVLQYDSPADAYAAYLAYSSDSSVEYVQPNRILHTCDDEEYEEETSPADGWGVKAIGPQEYLAELAARPGKHPDIRVAVIDTGIYPEHNLLKDRIAEGGMSFLPENDGTYRDGHGHGTHCAGIVCSVTNDNVRILPIKALSDGGYGGSIEIYCAMAYAAEQNVDVCSMSIGGLGESPLLDEGSALLAEKGIPLAAAAGNETMEARYSHPANYDGNFTVSAIEQEDEDYVLASYSNYGDMIDFSAPGSDILSCGISSPDSTVYMSGTSMATPFVAGVIASVLDYNPDYTNDEVYEILRMNAADLGDTGYDGEFGWGMVQLQNIEFPDTTCQKPKPSLEPGLYYGKQSLKLTCGTAGAKIYYTLDGSEPAPETGILYDGTPITVDESMTVSAVAFSDSGKSRTWYGFYEIQSSIPTASPDTGTYSASSVKVTLTAENADAIYYTIDGSDPGDGIGTKYTGAVTLKDTTILKAVSVSGKAVSEIMYAEYDFGEGSWATMCVIDENGVLTAYKGARAELDLTELPDGTEITAIGDGAFENNQALTSIVLPSTVTTIGADAFRSCRNLVSVRADSITELGDGAFRGCVSLSSPALDWTIIKTVGAYAFCEVPLNPDEYYINLDSLEQLGEYAFCSAGCYTNFSAYGYEGPIPEGVFKDARFDSIEINTVTEIGKEAFAMSPHPSEGLTSVSLENAEAVETIPAHAFANANISASLFPSVTTVEPYAFEQIYSYLLSLPKLKALPDHMLSAVSLSWASFEGAETVGTQALCGEIDYALFGRNLTAFDEQVFSMPDHLSYLAAPAGSPAEQYARRNNIPFVKTPAVLIDVTNLSFSQYEECWIYTTNLSCGDAVYWRQFTDEACSEVIGGDIKAELTDEMTEATLVPSTAAPGTFYYAAGTYENGEWVQCSDVLTLRVTESEVAGTIPSDAPYFVVDWNDPSVNPNADPYAMRTTVYQYTADHDGTYFLTLDRGVSAAVHRPESGLYIRYYSDDSPYEGMEYSGPEASVPDYFTLKKGETVYIAVFGLSYSRYSVIQIRETLPEIDLRNSAYYGDLDMIPFEKSPLTVSVDLTYFPDETLKLTEGENYFLLYENNTTPGRFSVTAVGFGNARGSLQLSGSSYGDITEGEHLITLPKFEERCYRFVPKKSGIYTFETTYPEAQIQAAVSADDPYRIKDIDTSLNLTDKNLDALEYVDSFDSYQRSEMAALSYSLTAGKEYYIKPALYGSLQTADVLFSITSERTDLETCTITMPVYLDLGEEPADPEIVVTAEDGSTLTEGKDYLVYLFGSRMAGTMDVMVKGIGNYCGTSWDTVPLLVQFASEEYVYTYDGEPFEVLGSRGIYSLYLEDDADIRFENLDGDGRFYRIGVFQYISEWDYYERLTVVRPDDPKSAEISLKAGTYYLYVIQDEAQSQFCWASKTVYYSLENADIEVAPLKETGEPLTPKVTVTLNGEVLTEGTDYKVDLPGEIVECGIYSLTVTGMGSYRGEASATFTVRPSSDAEYQSVESGDLTYDTADDSLLIWKADSPKACIWKDDLLYETVAVLDKNMEIVASISGCGYQFFDFYPEVGKEYYIAAGFADPDYSGTFTYHLVTDFGLLTACNAEYEQMQPYADGTAVVPEYTITDDGYTLKENTDYYVEYIGGDTRMGEAEISLIGMGHYVGTLVFNYQIYPDASVMKDLVAEKLTLNEEAEEMRDYPETMHLFTYTAESDGTYYLSLPNSWNGAVTAFVYQADGTIMMPTPKKITLSKGETVSILCVTNYLESFYDVTDAFSVSVMTTPIADYYWDGMLSWEIYDDEAILDYFPDEFRGVSIPEHLEDEASGISARFAGVSEELAEMLADHYVVYCEPGGAVENWCRDNGVCFAYEAPETSITGDITGDAVLDQSDLRTMLYCLSESPGMILSDAAFANADCDGDGLLTMGDVSQLLKMLAAQE
ncbi:MAG: S8 family serine peptidase [Oscillospiraceae bacterium]|nr:S8 family serine peptidase [Oscillospiraceae bacterium]